MKKKTNMNSPNPSQSVRLPPHWPLARTKRGWLRVKMLVLSPGEIHDDLDDGDVDENENDNDDN